MTIMTNKNINLLPYARLRAIRISYFVRFATIATAITATLVFIYGLMLIPTYLSLKSKFEDQQHVLKNLKSQLATQDIKNTEVRLRALKQNTVFLSTLGKVSMSGTAIRLVLSVPHNGISLRQIVFSAPSAEKNGKMIVTGNALTRETLQRYQRALEKVSFISDVKLPIDAYAKDSSIPFTITLVGAFKS